MTRSWLQTFTGRRIDVEDPTPDDIDVEDIAHHLAHTNRFGGALALPYSVAQHSVIVSRICDPNHALLGLLHDAHEAYLGDVITPVKALIPGLRRLELRWNAAIGERFGLEPDTLSSLPDDVTRADKAAMAAEIRDLVPKEQQWFVSSLLVGKVGKIVPQPAAAAKALFLRRYEELTTVRMRRATGGG